MTREEIAFVAACVATIVVLRWLLWLALAHALHLSRHGLTLAERGTRSWRRRIEARWPRIYRWSAGRFRTDSFSGLALTLIVIASAYVVFLFAGLVEEVLEAEEIEAADAAVADVLHPFRGDVLVMVFSWVTEFGDTSTLTAVAIISTGFLWSHGPRRFILPVWITVIGSQFTTWTGKFMIDRPRPDFVFDVTAYSPSFPSGHATGAMAVYGVLAYALTRDLASPRQRFEIAYWMGVLIVLVGFSRVFVSVHFPSDVAAGFLVGAFWLLAGIVVSELLRDHPRRRV